MQGDATIGVLFALFGALVGCIGVPVFLVVVFLKLRGAKQEVAQTAAAVQSGAIADLLPWSSASLSELTREWVGASTYTVGALGRNDQAGGRVPSGRSAQGWLLAFSMEAQNNGADGLVQASTSAHRIELRIAGGVCQASFNGAPLGTFRLGEVGLFTPQATALGSYRREPPVAQLIVREREVATIDTRTQSDSARVTAPTFLVTHLLGARSAEDEAWVLVAAVLELAWFGPRMTHVQMQGRLRG